MDIYLMGGFSLFLLCKNKQHQHPQLVLLLTRGPPMDAQGRLPIHVDDRETLTTYRSTPVAAFAHIPKSVR